MHPAAPSVVRRDRPGRATDHSDGLPGLGVLIDKGRGRGRRPARWWRLCAAATTLLVTAGPALAATGVPASAVGNDPATAAWRWQNPLPQGNNLGGVWFTDAETGTAVGTNGTILRTTDGGNTWTFQSSGPAEARFTDIAFTDPDTAIAVGTGAKAPARLMITQDGGATWISPQRSRGS